ncbi:ABC transporter substrate-binding protein [Sungkyunkwania multivorans]|uniref:ABC transporter substrate-binding protein n=1 Tax=Sungkyunkwania multivorans TaxID=1173618 RepID=A0ABW3D0L8_9FLAO
MNKSILPFLLLLLVSCGKEKKEQPAPFEKPQQENTTVIKYAAGFTIEKGEVLTTIEVSTPWPDAERTYKYALIPREKALYTSVNVDTYDAVILTPVERLVVTSTTHIPALEMLDVEGTLVGFPSIEYISSEKTRRNVEAGKVKEVGSNEAINTEVLIDLQPEVVIGFSINSSNKAYERIKSANIPVVYNGDWTERTPLGRAEWIKFFAPFFGKEKAGDSVFSSIEKEYLKAREMVKKTTNRPSVLGGAMYKDVWYLPAGESFQAQFLKDANADYLWEDSEGTGSLSLSFENVLEKAKNVEFWIAPGQFSSYQEMKEADNHYEQFAAFQNKNIYTFNLTKGATGGILYYELAPYQPHIVLKDMIKILHPTIPFEHENVFFKPLK